MNMQICRGCGAPIEWIKMASGKMMPCDAQKVLYWKNDGAKTKIVTQDGNVISAELSGDQKEATGYGFVSHYATCPEANHFRRRDHE